VKLLTKWSRVQKSVCLSKFVEIPSGPNL